VDTKVEVQYLRRRCQRGTDSQSVLYKGASITPTEASRVSPHRDGSSTLRQPLQNDRPRIGARTPVPKLTGAGNVFIVENGVM